MSQTWSSRKKDKTFKSQFPLVSKQSLTFMVVLREWSGPWMRFQRGPQPVQLSYQMQAVSPFLMIQRVPSSQMDLAFKRPFQVRDFLLLAFKVSRYFFLKVSAQILPAFVWNSHNVLAKRALFWLMFFVTPRPLRGFGFATTSQLIDASFSLWSSHPKGSCD